MKNFLMNVLAEGDKIAMKAASICVASIAAVEVPDNMWDGFLEAFSKSATQTEEQKLRSAAILTLGYFCEFII